MIGRQEIILEKLRRKKRQLGGMVSAMVMGRYQTFQENEREKIKKKKKRKLGGTVSAMVMGRLKAKKRRRKTIKKYKN